VTVRSRLARLEKRTGPVAFLLRRRVLCEVRMSNSDNDRERALASAGLAGADGDIVRLILREYPGEPRDPAFVARVASVQESQ